MKTISGIAVDEFTMGYLVCALWSSNDESTPEGGEPFDANHSCDDFAPDALRQAVDDCARFQRDNAALLTIAYGEYQCSDSTPEAHAGHDFWLTRNGHGAGFWDGDLPRSGDALTTAAKVYRETSPYLGDDGMIYFQ